MIVALVTRKKKKQANITFKAGSGHFLLLPAKAGDAVFDTEAGGPHHWPLQMLQTVVFKTMQFFCQCFDTPGSSWDGSHTPLASFKMASRQWVFSKPGKNSGADLRRG